MFSSRGSISSDAPNRAFPITAAAPPWCRTHASAWRMTTGKPVASTAKSAPPLQSLRISATASVVCELNRVRRPERAGEGELVRVDVHRDHRAWQPESDAAATAHDPIPPTPNTTTLCPGRGWAVLNTTPAPVGTAHPTSAAAAFDMPSGTSAQPVLS